MEATGANASVTSQAIKGDSYYGYSDGLHTIQLVYGSSFAGNVHIQASLELEPITSDWFDISPTSTGTSFTTIGTETYAIIPGLTGSEAYTFTGNYPNIRVYMEGRTAGQINKAIMSA